MNGKIAYPGSNSPLVNTMNFGVPAFREAVAYMGMEHFRFPGGTIANSFQMYPRRLRTDGASVLNEDEYFIDAAQNLLSSIEDDFDLDLRKDQEYADYLVCYQILLDIEGSGNTLNNQQEQELLTIVFKHSTRAAGMAKSILTIYERADFPEVLVHPDMAPKSMARSRKYPESNSALNLTLFPNPTSDHLIIHFIEGSPSSGVLIILDSKGRMVKERTFFNSHDIFIELKGLSSGNYIVAIELSGEKTLFRNFEIVK